MPTWPAWVRSGAGQSRRTTTVFDLNAEGLGLGEGGTGVLYVDGAEVARNSIEHTTPITFPEDETFNVGQDTHNPLALTECRCDVPLKFTGKIDKPTFRFRPEQNGARH